MANTASAAKRARQTKRRTATNKRALTVLKTQVKAARVAIAGKKDDVKSAISKAASTLDKAVKTGRIHRNKANRTKSRLAKAAAAAK